MPDAQPGDASGANRTSPDMPIQLYGRAPRKRKGAGSNPAIGLCAAGTECEWGITTG